ncbi:MAG: rhodanese-like domain-containing protein [Sideroxydans sp.]|nr:rhodanese-like domain-containing protein [Sideroxydans sp.]
MKRLLLKIKSLFTVPHNQPSAAARHATINVRQAQALQQQGGLLLDVRDAHEYALIHAPRTTHIPLGQLNQRMNNLAAYQDQPVAVMCRSGMRSAQAVKLLRLAGYRQLSNVSGGMNAWEGAGLEVLRGKH